MSTIKRQQAQDQANRWRDKALLAREVMYQRGERRSGDIVFNVFDQLAQGNPDYYRAYKLMKTTPVTIQEFLSEPYYTGGRLELWDSVRAEIEALCPDYLVGGTVPKTEAFLGGATNIGKTYLMVGAMAYHAYFLTCFHTPQKLFAGLDTNTMLVFFMQAVRDSVTKRVMYDPLRRLLTGMPYFRDYVQWDKLRERSLVINGCIEIVPALASVDSVVGSAVIGCAVDEANRMQVVAESKRTPGARGKGGKFDQAEELYKELSRRRASRFVTRGPNPGTLMFSSSALYDGDFIDRRIKSVAGLHEDDARSVHVYRATQYEARPAHIFVDMPRFDFLVGTKEYSPRILEAGWFPEELPEDADVRSIPVLYRKMFTDDPDGAQRDILGLVSSAIGRFMPRVEKVAEVFSRGEAMLPWVDRQNVILVEDGMPVWIPENLPADKDTPRFAHIDLSTSKDRCGVAILRQDGYSSISDGDTSDGVAEYLPNAVVEVAVSLQPGGGAEVDIPTVRRWVLKLREYGINLYMLTYDGFESKESRQVLRNTGVLTDCISMDRSPDNYEGLRSAIYQDRLTSVGNEILHEELVDLERNAKTQKIDHPPSGSKDVADAVCGAYSAMLKSRNVRVHTKAGEAESTGRRTTQRKTIGRARR